MFGKLGGHLLFQIDSMLDWSFLRKPQHWNRRNSSKPFFHVLGDLARSLLSRPPPTSQARHSGNGTVEATEISHLLDYKYLCVGTWASMYLGVWFSITKQYSPVAVCACSQQPGPRRAWTWSVTKDTPPQPKPQIQHSACWDVCAVSPATCRTHLRQTCLPINLPDSKHLPHSTLLQVSHLCRRC